jgi:alpha-tubulin suppressor-like RCC1 family protein
MKTIKSGFRFGTIVGIFVVAFSFVHVQMAAETTSATKEPIHSNGRMLTLKFNPLDYADLRLQITNVANCRISGLIQNSSALVPCAIFSKHSLRDVVWSPVATYYGNAATNVTLFSIPMLDRCTLLLRAQTPLATRALGSENENTVVLKRDGTVWVWGINDAGELGNGQWTGSPVPVQASGLSNIMAVVTPQYGYFTLALDFDGVIWSWGMGDEGQLGRGDGLLYDENLPAPVTGLSNIVSMAAGCANCAAVRSDGTVWTWGHGWSGKLGDGFKGVRDYPGMVPGVTNAAIVAAGADHVLALCTDGTVRVWGYNRYGQLGIGNTDNQLYPVGVTALTNVVALAGGDRHSIALLSDGTVKAWGSGRYGQLGNGGVADSLTPVAVAGLSNIVAIASGGFHNLASDASGNLYEWGDNSWDQLGNGIPYQANSPVLLDSVSNVVAIAAGEYSSAVMTLDGNVYQWGVYGYWGIDDWRQRASPFLYNLYDLQDTDSDGLPDWYEEQIGTATANIDTDSDSVSDYQEVYAGTDPLDPDSN